MLICRGNIVSASVQVFVERRLICKACRRIGSLQKCTQPSTDSGNHLGFLFTCSARACPALVEPASPSVKSARAQLLLQLWYRCALCWKWALCGMVQLFCFWPACLKLQRICSCVNCPMMFHAGNCHQLPLPPRYPLHPGCVTKCLEWPRTT